LFSSSSCVAVNRGTEIAQILLQIS